VTSMETPVAPKLTSRKRMEIPRWDQELRHAKNISALVKVQLAVEAWFADEECTVSGYVLDIDRNGIKIKSVKGTFWIARAFIIGTEIAE
jgi:hypothetical protein